MTLASPLAASLALGRRVEQRGAEEGAPRARVWVLRNGTVDVLADLLRAEGKARGLVIESELSLLDPEASARASDPGGPVPHCALLLLSLAHLPGAFAGGRLQVETVFRRVEALARAALGRGSRQVLICTFARPLGAPWNDPDAAALYELNARVARLAEGDPRHGLIDVAGVASVLGERDAIDDRFWKLFDAPYSTRLLKLVAELVAARVAVASGQARKVLVLDCDNTLWSGIVGEDGLSGIAMSAHDAKGRPFHTFQCQLAALKQRGVLLALASKNEPDDVHRVFEQHPEAVLRREDFVAERIGWGDKVASLRQLSAELRLGLESFVFVDDSPVECEHVRLALPMVEVLQVPPRSEELPRLLRSLLTLGGGPQTSEDQRRSEDYKNEALRRAAADACADLPSFVKSIEVRVEVGPLAPAELERASQLSLRTNQFTLTTRRYQVAELEQAMADKDALVLRAVVGDRFGEQGLTGLAVARWVDGAVTIEAFMLSCRVLGRFVEQAFLAALVESVRERFGQVEIVGEYRPSAKNGQTKSFYPRCQFFETESEAGTLRFHLPAWCEPASPDCISLSRRAS